MSMLRTAQALLEEQYNRKNIRNMVTEDIIKSDLGNAAVMATTLIKGYLARDDYYASKEARIDLLLDTEITVIELVQEILIAVMLSTEPQPIQAVSARLAEHLPYEDDVDAIRTASELIAVAAASGFYEIVSTSESDTGTLMVRSFCVLEPETLKAIERTKYMPPMVTMPHILSEENGNVDNSHITFVDHLVLGKENNHSEPIAIDAINIANQVKLELDPRILLMTETPNKELDTPEKLKQFEKMARDSREVYDEIVELGREFYLTWKYDFRGRMYSSGYHINHQSTGYKKALINLAHKEVISL